MRVGRVEEEGWGARRRRERRRREWRKGMWMIIYIAVHAAIPVMIKNAHGERIGGTLEVDCTSWGLPGHRPRYRNTPPYYAAHPMSSRSSVRLLGSRDSGRIFCPFEMGWGVGGCVNAAGGASRRSVKNKNKGVLVIHPLTFPAHPHQPSIDPKKAPSTDFW